MSEKEVCFIEATKELSPEQVTEQLLAIIAGWLADEDAWTTEVQQQMLASHVKAMVVRSRTGEPLPEVDVSLFDEISDESKALSQRVVDMLPGLAWEEMLLLSVHFEIARSNPPQTE
ncbi:MAG: transcriptional antiterminator [Enterobacteriaceae bacterium]